MQNMHSAFFDISFSKLNEDSSLSLAVCACVCVHMHVKTPIILYFHSFFLHKGRAKLITVESRPHLKSNLAHKVYIKVIVKNLIKQKWQRE